MKRVFPILYFIMLATLLFRLPTLSAQQKWTIDAILEAERIIDPMVSPNGDHAFYLLGCTKNGYPVTPSEAYSITLDGGKIVCISTEKGLGNNYKWSPDSKWISFITDSPTIKGVKQVWGISPNGEELTQLTSSDKSIHDYSWSPDGKQLLYTTKMPLSSEEIAYNLKISFKIPNSS
jgi:Tol biopolymer transport system component